MSATVPKSVPHFRDAMTNWLLYFAVLGGVFGGVFAFLVRPIGEGNGVLAATFFGVAGYIITLLYDGMQNREAVAMACYVTVRSHYAFARNELNPEALLASRAKSLAIESGQEKPSPPFGPATPDPYRFLPMQPSGVQELRPDTIRLLTDWHIQDQELTTYWQLLETEAFAAIGSARINKFYDILRDTTWPNYEAACRSALIALAGELPRVPDLTAEIQNLFRVSDEPA